MPSDFAGFQCHAIQNRSKKKSKLVSRLHNFWLLYCRITSGFFQYCYVLAAYCPLHGFPFDLREKKKIRTFLVARFNFKLSCFTNPPFTNPRFTNPCFTNPPFTNPCFTNQLLQIHVLQIHLLQIHLLQIHVLQIHLLQIHSMFYTPLQSTPLHSTPCFTICPGNHTTENV